MTDIVRCYKDLKVWQKAIDLVARIYETARSFPRSEDFALSNQMRRAALSVPSNIAEGQARQYRMEFLQSLHIARGSLAELETLLIVAERVGYLNRPSSISLLEDVSEVGRMLQGLINAL